jgi:lipoprotein signal peptidase
MNSQPKYIPISTLLGAFFVLVDMIVKQVLFSYYAHTISLNTAVAFGWGSASFVGVGLIILIAVGFLIHFRPRALWDVLGLAIFSNLVDRLFRGGVVDYIPFFGTRLNIADIVICLTIGAIAIHVFTKKDA